MSGPSIPCGGCIISSIGKFCCCTSISTSRSSSCPSFNCWRSFSRVRRRRSCASVSASATFGCTSPFDDTTNNVRCPAAVPCSPLPPPAAPRRGFGAARRAGERDVVPHDLVPSLFGRLGRAPPVPDRARGGLLRRFLTNDVAVHVGHGLPWRQLLQPRERVLRAWEGG